MQIHIPIEAGLTGVTLHYGPLQVVSTVDPPTARWIGLAGKKLPQLTDIFHGPNAMNEAIAAAKRQGVIK